MLFISAFFSLFLLFITWLTMFFPLDVFFYFSFHWHHRTTTIDFLTNERMLVFACPHFFSFAVISVNALHLVVAVCVFFICVFFFCYDSLYHCILNIFFEIENNFSDFYKCVSFCSEKRDSKGLEWKRATHTKSVAIYSLFVSLSLCVCVSLKQIACLDILYVNG